MSDWTWSRRKTERGRTEHYISLSNGDKVVLRRCGSDVGSHVVWPKNWLPRRHVGGRLSTMEWLSDSDLWDILPHRMIQRGCGPIAAAKEVIEHRLDYMRSV